MKTYAAVRLATLAAVTALLAGLALAQDPARTPPAPDAQAPAASESRAAAEPSARDAAATGAAEATDAAEPTERDAAAKSAADAAAPAPTSPRKPAAATGSPQRFEPTEKVRPDFDVAFPVDI
jgi:hypothetical protein